MIRSFYKKKFEFRLRVAAFLFFFFIGFNAFSQVHDIYFCGERIPLEDKFIENQLMNIIRRNINYMNLPAIRRNINRYMPQVENYLQQANLPQDFKYLAIVESGFKIDALSPVGAFGFWQLMKPTAREWGLVVNDLIDERGDFDKCTMAACKEIARNYKILGDSASWVLTAAAFNVGIGRIKKTITRDKTTNYFTMSLNKETAEYVYKIIAVKELYEYPELYMKNFKYNVFNTTATDAASKGIDISAKTDVSAFNSVKVFFQRTDGEHPRDLTQAYSRKSSNNDRVKVAQVRATVVGKYKHIQDGGFVTLKLKDNFEYKGDLFVKGTSMRVPAWVIDDRVMIDLGYGHNVTLYDYEAKKGVALSQIKNKQPDVIIEITK